MKHALLKLENPDLPKLVWNLKKLEDLRLDGVNMSTSGNKWCEALSSGVPNLRILSLTGCSLSGPIDRLLLKLRSLSVIHLDRNNLSTQVPVFLANFSNLTSLSLARCDLGGTFPNQIVKVPTLRYLNILDNQNLQGTLPEFSQNNSLERLALSITNFSGRLPESIGDLSKLTRLDLSSCQFYGKLPNSIAKLTQLVYLDLSFNNFTGPIPPFSMSKSLTEIFLSHNSLDGSISSTQWEGLQNLAVVDMRYNLFSGSVPSSLFELPSLEVIQLSYNHFSQLPKLPNVASSPLHVLDLDSNSLEGTIPSFFFDLRKLNVLSLSSNKFNGSINLETFCRLANLTTLDLSYNSLFLDTDGNHSAWSSISKIVTLSLASCNLTVFPDLKNHSRLVSLDLSENQIHGEVPNWIWEIGNGYLHHLNLSYNYLTELQEPYTVGEFLYTLDLHFNLIQGKIPRLPPYASYIDLSNNNFSSSIPPRLGNNDTISSLFFLSFANNDLGGAIPTSICYANSLKVLDFSGNSLSGEIPACVFEFMSQNLGVLNVKGNELSGPIHDAFLWNCSLKTLVLNGNQMHGRLPKSLANCSALEVLDLGNNEITDKFPCFLENISTLRVLVLRSNGFHGSINCESAKEKWPVLQIFDIARNSLSGELPRQWLRNSRVMTAEDNAKSKLDHLRFDFLMLSPTLYYRNAVTVTSKGLNMDLVKILTIFTCIDFSSNRFQGLIPEEFGELRGLYILNLSDNDLTGQIPSSLENLQHLESLDLSWNNLTGAIPSSLGLLGFLSFLNLSFNHLFGKIPNSNQLQTFLEDLFIGNEGLCDFPLKRSCTDKAESPQQSNSRSGTQLAINWTVISGLAGFVFGFAVIVWPVVFIKRWRRVYFDRIDEIGVRIFPRLYQTGNSK